MRNYDGLFVRVCLYSPFNSNLHIFLQQLWENNISWIRNGNFCPVCLPRVFGHLYIKFKQLIYFDEFIEIFDVPDRIFIFFFVWMTTITKLNFSHVRKLPASLILHEIWLFVDKKNFIKIFGNLPCTWKEKKKNWFLAEKKIETRDVRIVW